MKKILRWIGIVLGVLLILILVAGTIFYFIGTNKFNERWDIAIPEFEVPTDEETIAEGERIFTTRDCGGCHGEDAGGQETFQVPMVISLYPSNLTRGGVGAYFEPGDYARAIKHGVGADGRPLLEMPSAQFQYMRADEIIALIAYIQSLPPVENDLPQSKSLVMGHVLMGAGVFPAPAAFVIDHDAVAFDAVTAGTSIENGESLAQQMCAGCHQENFTGGPLEYDPSTIVPNITSHEDGIAGWSLEDFITTIRTGVNPDGDQLEDPMPWERLALLTNEELESIYLYLQSVEPLPQGE